MECCCRSGGGSHTNRLMNRHCSAAPVLKPEAVLADLVADLDDCRAMLTLTFRNVDE